MKKHAKLTNAIYACMTQPDTFYFQTLYENINIHTNNISMEYL